MLRLGANMNRVLILFLFLVNTLLIESNSYAKVIHVCDTCGRKTIEQGVKDIVSPGIDLLYLHDLAHGTPGYHITKKEECPGGIISLTNQEVTSELKIDNICPAMRFYVINVKFLYPFDTSKDGIHDLRRNCFYGEHSSFKLRNPSASTFSVNDIWSGNWDDSIDYYGSQLTLTNGLIYGVNTSGVMGARMGNGVILHSSTGAHSFDGLYLKNKDKGIQTESPITISNGRTSEVQNFLTQSTDKADVIIDKYFIDDSGNASYNLFSATSSPDLKFSNSQITSCEGTIFSGDFNKLDLNTDYISLNTNADLTKSVKVKELGQFIDVTASVTNRSGTKIILESDETANVRLRGSYLIGFNGVNLGGVKANSTIDNTYMTALGALGQSFDFKSSKKTRLVNSSFGFDKPSFSIYGLSSFPQGVTDTATALQGVSWVVANSVFFSGVKFGWTASPSLPTSIKILQDADLIPKNKPIDFGDNNWGLPTTGTVNPQDCASYDVYNCDKMSSINTNFTPATPATPPSWPDATCKKLTDETEITFACNLLEATDGTDEFDCPGEIEEATTDSH